MKNTTHAVLEFGGRRPVRHLAECGRSKRAGSLVVAIPPARPRRWKATWSERRGAVPAYPIKFAADEANDESSKASQSPKS